MRIARVMLWVLAVSVPLSIVAIFFLPALLYLTVAWRIVGGLLYFNMFLGLAAVCVQGYERGRWRGVMIGGVITSGLAFIAWTGVLFAEDHSGEWWKWMPGVLTTLTAAAAYPAFASVLLTRAAMTAAAWMRWTVLALAAILALHASAATLAFPLLDMSVAAEEAYVFRHIRWCAAYGVLIALAVFAALAVYYVRMVTRGQESMVVRLPVNLTCPRCAMSQRLLTEGDACERCGLRIKVSIP